MRNPLHRNSNHHSDDLTHRTRAISSVLALAFVYGSPLQAATQEGVINEPDVPAAIIGEAPPLKGEAIAYFPDSPKTSGYLSLPEGNIKGGVILIHEWNGLSQRIRETADAFAAEGYAALAADLYQGRIGQSRSENLALVRETQIRPRVDHRQSQCSGVGLKGPIGCGKDRDRRLVFRRRRCVVVRPRRRNSRGDRYLLRTPCHRPGFSARDYARSLRYLCWARSRPQRV